MSAPVVLWHGTQAESWDLVAAVKANCECRFDRTTGARLSVCGSHQLLTDQRALDGLLVNRRRQMQLTTQEYVV